MSGVCNDVVMTTPGFTVGLGGEKSESNELKESKLHVLMPEVDEYRVCDSSAQFENSEPTTTCGERLLISLLTMNGSYGTAFLSPIGAGRNPYFSAMELSRIARALEEELFLFLFLRSTPLLFAGLLVSSLRSMSRPSFKTVGVVVDFFGLVCCFFFWDLPRDLSEPSSRMAPWFVVPELCLSVSLLAIEL